MAQLHADSYHHFSAELPAVRPQRGLQRPIATSHHRHEKQLVSTDTLSKLFAAQPGVIKRADLLGEKMRFRHFLEHPPLSLKDHILHGAREISPNALDHESVLRQFFPKNHKYLKVSNWSSGGGVYMVPQPEVCAKFENIFRRISQELMGDDNSAIGRLGLFHAHCVTNPHTDKDYLVTHAFEYPDDLAFGPKVSEWERITGRHGFSSSDRVFKARNGVYSFHDDTLWIPDFAARGRSAHPWSAVLDPYSGRALTVNPDALGHSWGNVNYFPRELTKDKLFVCVPHK